MDRAISEAIAALEMALFYRKYVGSPRHIEICYGRQSWNVLYLLKENAASSVVTKSN
jgi:hypothetical protein